MDKLRALYALSKRTNPFSGLLMVQLFAVANGTNDEEATIYNIQSFEPFSNEKHINLNENFMKCLVRE